MNSTQPFKSNRPFVGQTNVLTGSINPQFLDKYLTISTVVQYIYEVQSHSFSHSCNDRLAVAFSFSEILVRYNKVDTYRVNSITTDEYVQENQMRNSCLPY